MGGSDGQLGRKVKTEESLRRTSEFLRKFCGIINPSTYSPLALEVESPVHLQGSQGKHARPINAVFQIPLAVVVDGPLSPPPSVQQHTFVLTKR